MARNSKQGKSNFDSDSPSRLSIALRLLLFFSYIAIFTILPPTILFDEYGFIVGLFGFLAILTYLYQNVYAIPKVLGARTLTKGHSPQVHHIVEELSARLRMRKPKLFFIPHGSINFAAVGISEDQQALIITRGAIDKLTRTQWIVFLSRALLTLRKGTILISLLSSYLHLVHFLLTWSSKNTNSWAYKLRKVFLYPFCFFPLLLLRPNTTFEIDNEVQKSLDSPDCIKGLYQTIQAQRESLDFRVPFSGEHLFFVPPDIQNPLRQFILDLEDIPRRLKRLRRIEAVS